MSHMVYNDVHMLLTAVSIDSVTQHVFMRRKEAESWRKSLASVTILVMGFLCICVPMCL